MIPVLLRFGGAIALAIAPIIAVEAEIPIQVHNGNAAEVHQQPDGSAVHRASGLPFPKELGPLRLGKLHVYGPSDASGTYYLSSRPNDTLLSYYIYPATQSLDAEEQSVVSGIARSWTATPINPPIALLLPAGARSGWFDVKNNQASGRSVYVVAQRGNWFVKARLTLAQDAGENGLELARTVVAALPWDSLKPSVGATGL